MITNETAVNQNLDDQQILCDLLASQKQIASTCNTFSSECAHEQVKCDLLNILRDEHNMQTDVFTQMQQRGWYPTPTADRSKIDAARTKFQTISGQLG